MIIVGFQSPEDLPFTENATSKNNSNAIDSVTALTNVGKWVEEMERKDHELKLPHYDILTAYTKLLFMLIFVIRLSCYH